MYENLFKGANFIAETFLFSVAGSLIFFESWRTRRKVRNRHEDVDEQIQILQEEVKLLKSQNDMLSEIKVKTHGNRLSSFDSRTEVTRQKVSATTGAQHNISANHNSALAQPVGTLLVN